MRCGALLAIFSGVLALVGCQSERAADPSQLQQMSAICQSYGFKSGTDPFAACMLQLDQARIAEAQRRRLAVADSLDDMSQSFYRNAQASRPVTCTSNRMGNTITTNCY